MHSVRSSTSRTESVRSFKSGAGSIRSRQIKAAHAAKRAASQYIAANREKPLLCYTCGNQLKEVKCESCRTSYVPPEFSFNAMSAAVFNFSEHSHGHEHENSLCAFEFSSTPLSRSKSHVGSISGASGFSVSSASMSGTSTSNRSISGVVSYIGFYPEGEEDDHVPRTRLDYELIKDLVSLNESELLEAVLFEGFSSAESIAQSFQFSQDRHTSRYTPPVCHDATISEPCNTATLSLAEDESTAKQAPIIDNVMVKELYNKLASVTSTGPMRGILQGAQCVLQTRRLAPINENDLAFICVVLQCPVLSDCSMFTKITGPLQKLSRYASLRSRARTILELCAGLLVHGDKEKHTQFVTVYASLDEAILGAIIDMCNAYVSHRLSFDMHYKSRSGATPSKFQLVKHEWYSNDWRLASVVRLMALLWQANKMRKANSATPALPTDRFYNTMVDLVDLKVDFDCWQRGKSHKRPQFVFCMYPFLLSMGSKAIVFEHSIQRVVNTTIQREMFAAMAGASPASAIIEAASFGIFELRIRRQHFFEDSINQLRLWPTSNRRRFRVEFVNEPGVDAGGLKKEWFLMFFKQLFDSDHDLFVIDETSNFYWFGNHSDVSYYRIAGIALGLALFNSVTVDLNLPPLLFKLLLDYPYDLSDIGKMWPDIAQSLQSILEYCNDDFEEVFGLTFTAPDGTELIAGGESTNVTLSSKETYVTLLVEHLISAQGKPFQEFKKAFMSVAGGNAILLFQPEELELFTRGDRKPIDVRALRSVTKYVNFGHRYEKANKVPVVQWFWDYFEKLDPASQACLLQFVTATDRPPAAGAVQMRFSILCLGGDSERLPIAHTCFNELGLYRYKSRSKLEHKLSLAIVEYQGFGLS